MDFYQFVEMAEKKPEIINLKAAKLGQFLS